MAAIKTVVRASLWAIALAALAGILFVWLACSLGNHKRHKE